MDDSIAISVRNVSKMYRLFASPKQRLMEAFHPFRKKYHHEFWALKDISFDVPRGSTLGIIGRNGSGKSTLLQIICSVLAPTSGVVDVRGKISALLELGSGFNPEFTGRDNVVFNGALTGFPRAEMEERLPEIEAFADIGEFFYQPVKTYSSGMFVRLAFAAAISVDPDILIVDEALAVGDINFQRKCYREFEKLRSDGKTLLIVSHNLDSINKFSDTAILLDGGEIVRAGEPQEVSRYYGNLILGPGGEHSDASDTISSSESSSVNGEGLLDVPTSFGEHLIVDRLQKPYADEGTHELRYGDRRAEIVDFGIIDKHGNRTKVLEMGGIFRFYLVVYFHKDLDDVRTGFAVVNVKGAVLYGTHSKDQNIHIVPQRAGNFLQAMFETEIPFTPGDYFASFGVTSEDGETVYDRRLDALHFRVQTANYDFKPESLVRLKTKVLLRDLTGLSVRAGSLTGSR